MQKKNKTKQNTNNKKHKKEKNNIQKNTQQKEHNVYVGVLRVCGVWVCGARCVGVWCVVCGCVGVGVCMCVWARAGVCVGSCFCLLFFCIFGFLFVRDFCFSLYVLSFSFFFRF